MLFQTGVGISIEKTVLSIVYLKASIREVRLEAHAVYDLPAEKPLEERLEVARDLIRSFLRKHNILSTDIYISIPGDMALIRQVELPLAVKENLRDTLGYEMEKYTPFPVEDVLFDCRIISEDKETGMLKVLLVVAEKNAVAPYLALCEKVEIGVSGMEINATALAGYLFHSCSSFPDGPSIVVFRTGGRMEIDLFRDNLLWYSRHLEVAEDGAGLSDLIKREVLLLGEKLEETDEKHQVLVLGPGLDSDHLSPFDGDDPFEMYPVHLSGAKIPSYDLIPAYGCALKAIRKMQMDINLLPVELRKKPDRRGYYAMLILGGLLLLSLLSWGGGTILRERIDLKRLDTQIEQLKGEVSRVEKVRARCGKLEEQITYLNKLTNHGGAPILDILRDLSDIIPESAWLSSITVSDADVRIEGYADSASELITLLEGSPLFKEVAFLSTITKTRDGTERFRIGLKARQG